MTIDLSVLNPDTRNWAQSTSTASVTLTGTGRTLTGTAAAAYLFGQALTTVKFNYNADGLQLTDGLFVFPPGSGQRVSLAEVADALRYKYGVDPLIEFAPGLGVRGYSVADINRILEALNREFADDFSLISIDIAVVKNHTTAALPATPASFTVASTATDTTAESFTFLNDPGWATGMPVRVSASNGGLTTGTDHFVRNLTGGKYAFYETADQAKALGNPLGNPLPTTGRRDLISNIAMTVSTSPRSGSTSTVDDSITFSLTDNPNWATGTPVQVSATGGGLKAGVDYYVRNLTGGKYALFSSQENAATGTTGRVDLTANNGALTLAPSPSSATVDDDWVTFASDPNWVTGTPVQVSASGGGLDADTVYFVRNLGNGRYDFFTSPGAALGTSSAGVRVNLTDPIGAVSASYSTTALNIVLNTASTPILAAATDTELRQSLTDGGDLYTDRFGAFYLNGVRTQAMDVAVTSRLLVQDNVSAEYKTLMDELAERNNLIAAARVTTESINATQGSSLAVRSRALSDTIQSLGSQYGEEDMLSVLTSGQVKLDAVNVAVLDALDALPAYFDRLDTRTTALKDFYTQAKADAQIRRTRYVAEGWTVDAAGTTTTGPKINMVSRIDALIVKFDGWLNDINEASNAINSLRTSSAGAYEGFQTDLDRLRANRPAGEDVFSWLKTFDVDPTYLWEGNWKQLEFPAYWAKFSTNDIQGQQVTGRWYIDRDLEEADITIGENSLWGPFDWTATNFGWFGSIVSSYGIFNEAQAKQRFVDYFGTEAPASFPPLWYSGHPTLNWEWARMVWDGYLDDQYFTDFVVPRGYTFTYSQNTYVAISEYGGSGRCDQNRWGVFDLTQWKAGGAIFSSPSQYSSSLSAYQGAANPGFSDALFLDNDALSGKDLDDTSALLNTLISNKVRDGDLDQAKLQTLTAQLQNNTEAMTALIKAFTEMNAQLARAL